MSRITVRALITSSSSSLTHFSNTRLQQPNSILTVLGTRAKTTLASRFSRQKKSISGIYSPQQQQRTYSWFSSRSQPFTSSSFNKKSATTGNSTSSFSTAIPASQQFQKEKMTQQKTEEEWRAVLTPEQFRVLRQKGTEMPYSGEYTKTREEGVYRCAGCQTPLYTSGTKFDACGWCSFYDAIPGAVGRHPDPDGHRVEIVCNACGGHLGHVFKGEGFGNPTDERHCVNSISLKFQPGDV